MMTMAFRWWLFALFLNFICHSSLAAEHDEATSLFSTPETPAPAADYRAPGREAESYQYKNCQTTESKRDGATSAGVSGPQMKMLRENVSDLSPLRQFHFSMDDGASNGESVEYLFEASGSYNAGQFKVWRGEARVFKSKLPAGVTANYGSDGQVATYSYAGNIYYPYQVAPYITRTESKMPMQYFEKAGAPPLRTFALYKEQTKRADGTHYSVSVMNNRGDYSEIIADANAYTGKKLYQTKKLCRGRRSGYLPFAANAIVNNAEDPAVPRNVPQEDLPYTRVGGVNFSTLNQYSEQIKLGQSLLEDSHYVSPAIQNFANSLLSGSFRNDPSWLLGQYVLAPVIHRP